MEVEDLDLLAELGVGPLSPVVESVIAVGNQPPLCVQFVFAFRYEAGDILPVDVIAASVFVQLPGFALDCYKGSIGAVDGYGVYAVVLACGFREETLPVRPFRPHPAMGNVPVLDVRCHLGRQDAPATSHLWIRAWLLPVFPVLGRLRRVRLSGSSSLLPPVGRCSGNQVRGFAGQIPCGSLSLALLPRRQHLQAMFHRYSVDSFRPQLRWHSRWWTTDSCFA